MQKALKKFSWAIALTSLILIGELIGGYFSHSLSLLSDAAHVFFDLSSLIISFTALALSKRYRNLENWAALINAMLLIVVAIGISYEALERWSHPREINSILMLTVAVWGFLGNGIVAWQLHDFAEKNINIRSAFYHVLGDLLASAGVIVAGVIIFFTGWKQVDALISLGIAATILYSTVTLLAKLRG